MSLSGMRAAMVMDPRQNPRKPEDSARRSLADESQAIVPYEQRPTRTVHVMNLRKSKKKKGKGSRFTVESMLKTEASQSLPLFPPEFNIAPIYRCRRRYIQSQSLAAGGFFPISHGHDQFLFAATTTQAYSFVECWRIKRISIWVISEDENPVTCFLLPGGVDIDSNCFNDREATFICSSRSQANPGRMEITPHVTSPLGSWHRTSTVNPTGNLFSMTIYGSSSNDCATMDIEYEYVLNTTGTTLGYAPTGVGLTPGILLARNVVESAGVRCFAIVGQNVF